MGGVTKQLRSPKTGRVASWEQKADAPCLPPQTFPPALQGEQNEAACKQWIHGRGHEKPVVSLKPVFVYPRIPSAKYAQPHARVDGPNRRGGKFPKDLGECVTLMDPQRQPYLPCLAWADGGTARA